MQPLYTQPKLSFQISQLKKEFTAIVCAFIILFVQVQHLNIFKIKLNN